MAVTGAGLWSVVDESAGWRGSAIRNRSPGWSLGRRGLQLALGALWILDGVLQLQPWMFTRRFADQVVAPTAAGQPVWVSWPVVHGAGFIASHAVMADLVFALVQLALGVGLLVPRTVRPALAASVAWAAGVWSMGEALGGMAGGTASFLTGAPGAALLYGIVALAAWPRPAGPSSNGTTSPDSVAPIWLPRVWAGLWVTLGATALLPANRSAARVASELTAVAGSAPGWLGHLDRVTAGGLRQAGCVSVVLLTVAPAAVGLLGLGGPGLRRAAAWSGIALAAGSWMVGQSFGQLLSGTATDPNTGPLLLVAGLALLGTTPSRHQSGAGDTLDDGPPSGRTGGPPV